MQYDSKEELIVLLAIEELGEASVPEISENIENHWQQLTDSEPKLITTDKLFRYVRRWNKRKAVSGNIVNGATVYSLADIPWYPKNQIIRCLKAPDDSQAKAFMDVYENKLSKRKSIRLPQGQYRDYESFKLTFETIDKIGGGIPAGDRKLAFPRTEDGDLYIPISWFKGWMRQNSGLGNMPSSVFMYYTGFSTGKFQKQPETKRELVKVKEGMTEYEYINHGEEFTMTLNFPLHGTAVKNKDQLEAWFKKLEVAPVRGLGAYPHHFGGRVKLINIE